MSSSAFSRAGWIRRAARAHARKTIVGVSTCGRRPAAARALSGGNMQKLILGRALTPPARRPQLIVAHQPTWGLDIGAVAIVQQAACWPRAMPGAAVLLISDDLDEDGAG